MVSPMKVYDDSDGISDNTIVDCQRKLLMSQWKFILFLISDCEDISSVTLFSYKLSTYKLFSKWQCSVDIL